MSSARSAPDISFVCSRQESNLELRYRKPKFYPLNYESKRVVKRKLAFFCTASAALAFEALAEEDSRANEESSKGFSLYLNSE